LAEKQSFSVLKMFAVGPLVSNVQQFKKCLVFTVLHVMQTRYSEENSVRPFVCPSHA